MCLSGPHEVVEVSVEVPLGPALREQVENGQDEHDPRKHGNRLNVADAVLDHL